jgi:LPS-assembly protein
MTVRASFISSCCAFRSALFLTVLVLVAALPLTPASAQTPDGLFSSAASKRARDPDAKMLLNANELVYDYATDRVSAVGDVQIYYDGSVLQADRVIYNQKTNKVRAFGNVTLKEPDGNIIRAADVELTDDLREGFINSLQVQTVDKASFAAVSAHRSGGNLTVLEKGVYTACASCNSDPAKPPLWRIKAARIIHDEKERMVYYEDARFEFMGKSIAWVPFLQHPDPTVKRKSGFLSPNYIASTKTGIGAEIPFFWNIAPNLDITVAPVIMSRQGVMLKGELRHRLLNGSYSVRAAGLVQADPDAFPAEPLGGGDKDARGTLQSTGHFDINERWSWGWDATLVSDRYVLDDYDLWGSNNSENISTLYLTGLGERNYFDLRAYHFLGLSRDDKQDELPVVAPLLDYNGVLDRPVLGGELSFNVNTATLYRNEADLQPISAANTSLSLGGAPINPGLYPGRNFSCVNFAVDCVARGIAGSYSRFSADTTWRRQFIDPIGQVWTPFAFLRGDVIWQDPEDSAAQAHFINTDSEFMLRGMAGIGLEYRYPFMAVNSVGTHVLEPIAQILIRPNETKIGDLPNEDAQSLIFDDTTLFAWDKFSGWDRVEGGSRANVGAQYTLTLNNGGFINVMFGQSLHLFGENSFATGDLANIGSESGLETDQSDYVSRLYFQPSRSLSFSSRFRFSEQDFDAKTIELESRFQRGAVAASVMYGKYDAQQSIGFSDVREGVLATTRIKLTDNFFVASGARYDLDRGTFDSSQIGFGYLDDCFAVSATYATDWSRNGNDGPEHKMLLRLALRTLGDGGIKNDNGDDVFKANESSGF